MGDKKLQNDGKILARKIVENMTQIKPESSYDYRMCGYINIRAYGELNDFLKPEQRGSEFELYLKNQRSVKDLIESIGIPHTEVDFIIVNDISVGFDFAIKASDRINLYPESKHPENALPLVHCQPTLPAEPRFVLDVHLGRLAAYLRMMGFDTLYQNDYDDPILANISAQEQRILLTCDRQLLMRKQVSYGYFVRSRQPGQQLLEIMRRFDLHEKQNPFTRCMHCNGITKPVEKKAIEQQLQTKTRNYYHEFYQCTQCKKIYWKGSHYRKMQNLISGIKTCL